MTAPNLQPWVGDMMAGWDLETTSTDTREARIAQWGAVLDHPRAAPSVLSDFVNPGVPMPAEAALVNGLTDEVLAQGSDPATSLDLMLTWLADTINARIPIVGMNLAYDFSVAHWEAIRHGIPTLLERTGGVVMPVLDVYVLDKMVDPYRSGSRRLADGPKGPGLATQYGVELRTEDAHDAVADTLAAVAVARSLARQWETVGSRPLTVLHTMQIEAKAVQAAGLQQWLRRTKDKQAFCDPCWPLCLDLTHPTGKAA